MLALAPGDPFGELATNPDIPPEVQAALRAKFGLDDPIPLRYLHWLVAMLHGDWGFSFASRINVDTLILQRLPTTLVVIGSSQMLALLIALPVGVYAGDAALFDLRPDRQHVRLHRLFAADLLHRPRCSSCCSASISTGCRSSIRADLAATGWRWYWEEFKQAIMPVAVLGLFQGAVLDALRALRRARRDPARLRHDRARQGPAPSAA